MSAIAMETESLCKFGLNLCFISLFHCSQSDQVTQQRHKKLYSLLGWFVLSLSLWFKESTVDSVGFLDEDWREKKYNIS